MKKLLMSVCLTVTCFALHAQPANDNRIDAILLDDLTTWSSVDAAYTTTGATPGNFNNTAPSGYQNVWFKFYATTAEIDIRIFTGGARGTLLNPTVRLFDASGTSLMFDKAPQHTITFIQNIGLMPGALYYFSVDSDGGMGPGTFTVQINDQVGYDLRDKAQQLPGFSLWTSADAAYTNVGATPGSFNNDGHAGYYNVWFKIQASSAEIDIRIFTGGSKGTLLNAFLSLYDDAGNRLVFHKVPQFNMAYIQHTTLTPGAWYYISVDTDGGAGPGTFTIQVNNDLGNDVKAGAEIIPHVAQWCSEAALYTNFTALPDETVTSSCGGYRNNIWFKFKATSTNVTAKLLTGPNNGTMTNPIAHLLQEDGTEISCASATNFNSAEISVSTLQKDSWYYLVVDNNGTKGSFTLCVEGGAAVINSFCEDIYCDGNGGVGIGALAIPEGFRLAVNGRILAEGVKVMLKEKWPDYVFDQDYKLLTLKEVKEYIDQNNHLPEIPSARDIEANGLDLEEMNVKLLKKIEELTIYQIQLLEKLEEQNLRIEKQNFQIELLKQEFEERNCSKKAE